MKLLHTADLHIGKTLHEFSMLEEQQNVLSQVIAIARKEKVDAVVIAGDVYDRAVPATEAVALLDDFLTAILEENIEIWMIAGNHDSAQRLQFANKILEKQGLFIVGVCEKEAIKSIYRTDEYGEVQIDFIPFFRPAVYEATNTGEAMEYVKNLLVLPKKKEMRRVCISHFFVTNAGMPPQMSDSESGVYVGGLDNIDASFFKEYDYTALGHIHKPQQIGEFPIYYAGSPLKYSFSEAYTDKAVNIVTLKEKGNTVVEKRKLIPIHGMRKIQGTLNQLIQKEVVEAENCMDYIQAILIDEIELVDPLGALRSVYPNLCQIILQKNYKSEQMEEHILQQCIPQKKSIYEVFCEFYSNVTGKQADESFQKAALEIIEEIEK